MTTTAYVCEKHKNLFLRRDHNGRYCALCRALARYAIEKQPVAMTAIPDHG